MNKRVNRVDERWEIVVKSLRSNLNISHCKVIGVHVICYSKLYEGMVMIHAVLNFLKFLD